MRIDTNQRVGNLGSRSATARASSSPFFVNDGTAAADSRPAATVAPATSLDALLALQAVEDPLLKKKLVRRGTQLLDTLEDMKADLLSGRVSESRLNHLMAVLGQTRDKADPRLDALLDDIELRARVELAKRGLFPA